MDTAQAISSVVERIRSHGLDYPVTGLTADRFHGGWCVYAPALIADGDEPEDLDMPVTRSVFLVGESGRVEEVESSAPAASAREWFAESCIWFSAQEPSLGTSDSSLPSHPDFSGLSRPRQPADYDREVIAVFARALTHERDFSGWLADRLRDLADLVGGSSRLISRHPNSWAAHHVRDLTEPHADDGPTGAWQTWPPVDPASLPDADITGWLLVPAVRMVEILEGLESVTPAATRLADVIADRARQAPPWRACGVAELTPQLVAVRRGDLQDADVDTLRRLAAEDGAEDVIDKLLVTPADADVQALLRFAVDAGRHQRNVIDLDAAATAAYRRVLDHLDLPFENYWLEAMFE
jgi:hypothetical protein